MRVRKVASILAASFLCLPMLAISQGTAYASSNDVLTAQEEPTFSVYGTCGQSFNPTIPGGKAHWTIDCVNGQAGIVGWVKDTRSDGKCIQVKALWSDGTTKLSPRACPKNSKKSFNMSHAGSAVNGYLFQS